MADLTKILAERAAKTNLSGAVLKNAILSGEKFGEVRKLSGFKKPRAGQWGHRVPDRHDDAADKFIRGIGEADVKELADEITKKIRASFNYLRKDIDYSYGNGEAVIITPDFDVNISIQQDSEDAGGYVLATEVGVNRRPGVVAPWESLGRV